MPAGAVNIVTGYASQLLKTLAEHDDVDAIWCFGDQAQTAAAKAASIGNLKQVFTNEGRAIDWFNPKLAEGRWFLEHAYQTDDSGRLIYPEQLYSCPKKSGKTGFADITLRIPKQHVQEAVRRLAEVP